MNALSFSPVSLIETLKYYKDLRENSMHSLNKILRFLSKHIIESHFSYQYFHNYSQQTNLNILEHIW